MSVAPSPAPGQAISCFMAGFRAAWLSFLAYVLIGTYVGISALAHDFGFSLWWVAASTLLVWAGPGQVILISAIGSGAAPLETALAVTVSSVRLLPMVVSLLPLMRAPDSRSRTLALAAHFTAVSMWIESLRLLPGMPRENRIAFSNGLGFGFLSAAQVGTLLGYHLANSLPPLLTAAVLFLTPLSFLISTTRNCRMLGDWLALAFGLVLTPLLIWVEVGLDVLWTGVVGGSLAYGLSRLRKTL